MDELDLVKKNKRKRAAYDDFLNFGIEFVEEHYPAELEFVCSVKNKSFEEVDELLNKEFMQSF